MASGTSQYITAEGTKQCNRCQEWFPVDGVPANRQLSTGLSSGAVCVIVRRCAGAGLRLPRRSTRTS